MPTFAEWLQQLSPTSFQDDGGKALFSTIGLQLDRGVDRLKQATRAHFPEKGPSDAQDTLGIERQLPRAPGEGDAAYGAYLKDAWTAWGGSSVYGGGAGTPAGILHALERAGFPVTYSSSLSGNAGATTIVSRNGRWMQLYSDKLTPIFGSLDLVRPDIATSFLPTDLGSTLKLWLRGDLGLAESGGNVVSVGDQSGNHLDVVPSGTIGVAANAVSGQAGWSFPGGSASLVNTVQNVVPSGSARTIFVVAKASSEYGGPLIETQRVSGTRAAYFLGGSAYSVPGLAFTDSFDASRNASFTPPPIASVPLICEFSCASNPAPLALRINGVSLALTQTNPCAAETGSAGFSVGGWAAGGTANYLGNIAEVIVCDTVLSAVDAERVRQYLSYRYAVRTRPGWTDDQFDQATAFTSKFWLLLFAPDSAIAGLTNDTGNPMKALLNATVERWSSGRSTYAGAWVIANPTWQSPVPGARDIRFNQRFLSRLTGPQYPVLGWPPSSIDSVGGTLNDQNYIGGQAPLFIGAT